MRLPSLAIAGHRWPSLAERRAWTAMLRAANTSLASPHELRRGTLGTRELRSAQVLRGGGRYWHHAGCSGSVARVAAAPQPADPRARGRARCRSVRTDI